MKAQFNVAEEVKRTKHFVDDVEDERREIHSVVEQRVKVQI